MFVARDVEMLVQFLMMSNDVIDLVGDRMTDRP